MSVPNLQNLQIVEGNVDYTGAIGQTNTNNFTVQVIPGMPNLYIIKYSKLFNYMPVFISSSDIPTAIIYNSYRETYVTAGAMLSFRAEGSSNITACYTIKRYATNSLINLNPVNGALLNFLNFTLTDLNLCYITTYGHALAADPTDKNSLYAVVATTNIDPIPIGNFRLIKINIVTKKAVTVSTLTERFAGLAFNSTGQLYGIVGKDAVNPLNVGKLYTINKSTGAIVFLYQLSAGVMPNAYHSIGFNPNNGLIYHLYGNSPDMSLESWNPALPLNAPVFISNVGLLSQWTGLGFTGDSDFIGLTVGVGMNTVNINGSYTNIGPYIGAITNGVAIVRQ